VALIGTGWYGKSDLFRLMQVAPVNVVALCDVDKRQLEHAAAMISERQMSKKKPSLYGDHQKLFGRAGSRYSIDRHLNRIIGMPFKP
jgi:predicted dehydrogenase